MVGFSQVVDDPYVVQANRYEVEYELSDVQLCFKYPSNYTNWRTVQNY